MDAFLFLLTLTYFALSPFYLPTNAPAPADNTFFLNKNEGVTF